MEFQNLPKSNTKDAVLSVAAVDQRCTLLSSKFCEELGLDTGSLSVFHEISDTVALFLLGGRASEVIERNTGTKHRVVQLCSIADELYAWFGFRETWQRMGSRRNFSFVSGGFTIHVGRTGEVQKPQIMRSEWMGRHSAEARSDVGQPHWHIDVLETARNSIHDMPAQFEANGEDEVVREFRFEGNAEIYEDLFFGITMERMHLASSAPWWQGADTKISHSPKTVSELDQWIFGCMAYIRQEMCRCQVR